jgi:hypothetical protein
MLSQRGVGCLTIPSHDEPTVGHNRIGRTETFVLESSQSRVLHTTYLPPLIFLPHFQNRRLKRRWRSKRDGGNCASSAGLPASPAGSQTTTRT